MQTPHPLNNSFDIREKTGSVFFKMFIIGFLALVVWVPTMFVLGVVNDRTGRADEASAEIATKWGREQTISGPVLAVPMRVPTVGADGVRVIEDRTIFLVPKTVSYDTSLDTKTLSRGIYDARVYESVVKGSGTFDLRDMDMSDVSGTVMWNEAQVLIGISDTRSVDQSAVFVWNGSDAAFEPGISSEAIGLSGIHAPVVVDRAHSENTFSFEIPLHGSEAIGFVPVGESTNVSISSNWPSPSFTGEFLPEERNVTDTGFTANWSVSSFGRSIPRSWIERDATPNDIVRENIRASVFGVGLYQNVDLYTQVERSIKYSILFIALTFLAFFMFEVLAKLRIHPMNYLFVGLSIAIFYLLLLSLSENVGFLAAYIVSTAAVVTLITGYCRSILKERKRAAAIAGLLGALYTYLYVLLQIDEFSLIVGSIFLFAVLSTVMYLTRNIDWYERTEG